MCLLPQNYNQVVTTCVKNEPRGPSPWGEMPPAPIKGYTSSKRLANLDRLCAELIIFFAGEWIICYICGKILTFTTMQENEGKYIFGVVKVGDKGQIVIPKEARTVYNIKPGDALLMLGDQKGMALLKTDIFQSVIDQTMEGLTK